MLGHSIWHDGAHDTGLIVIGILFLCGCFIYFVYRMCACTNKNVCVCVRVSVCLHTACVDLSP